MGTEPMARWPTVLQVVLLRVISINLSPVHGLEPTLRGHETELSSDHRADAGAVKRPVHACPEQHLTRPRFGCFGPSESSPAPHPRLAITRRRAASDLRPRCLPVPQPSPR